MTRLLELSILIHCRMTGALGRWLSRRRAPTTPTGQSTIEWVLITSSLAVGIVTILQLLTGALTEYFTAFADWLRQNRPV